MKFRVTRMLFVVATLTMGQHLFPESFQTLMDQGKVPQPRYLKVLFIPAPVTVLDLSNLKLDSWEGFEKLPLEEIQFLRLNGNRFKEVPAGVFAANKHAKNLRGLDLSNNQIANIKPRSFEGLDKLWVLVLSSNQIATVVRNEMSGMPRLKMLSIYNNPISASLESAQALQKQVPHAFVWNKPLTKKRLQKAGIFAAGLTAVILVTVGVGRYVMVQPKGENLKSGHEVERGRRVEAFRIVLERSVSEGLADKQIQLDYLGSLETLDDKIAYMEKDEATRVEIAKEWMYVKTLSEKEQKAYLTLPEIIQKNMAKRVIFKEYLPSHVRTMWQGLSPAEQRATLETSDESGVEDMGRTIVTKAIMKGATSQVAASSSEGRSIYNLPQDQKQVDGNMLDLSNKRLTSIAGLLDLDTEDLKKIEQLDLSNNKLQELPTDILEKLPNLQEISITNNRFSEEEIEQLEIYLKGRQAITGKEIYLFKKGQKE